MNLKRLFASTLILLSLSSTMMLPASAFADANADICSGIGASSSSSHGSTTCSTSGPTVENVINSVVKILSIIIGAASIIMIMFAGYRYITSGGDTGKVSSAKNTLIYALIGLAVAALAQVFVNVVLTTSSTIH